MTPRALPTTAARDLARTEDRWLRSSADRLRRRALERRVARAERTDRSATDGEAAR